jgi:vacuolar-type H+-ATPase subunit H
MKTRSKIIVAAAAAGMAAVGYYFYGSKNAKQNRKIAAVWADRMKKDVVKQVKGLEVASQEAVQGAIDSVSKAYVGAKNLNQKDLAKAVAELKKNWKLLRDEAGKAGSSVTSKVKKAIKKVQG